MDSKIIKTISNVLNPVSDKTLASEGKIIDISLKDKVLKVGYLSTDIPVDQKRIIEKRLIESVRKFGEIEQVIVHAQTSNKHNMEKGVVLDNQKKKIVSERKKIDGVKKIIAISSAKGGVGKSTVAANIALFLSQKGKTVGLLDADIYGPSIPKIFEIENVGPVVNNKKKVVPVRKNEIDIISFGLFSSKEDPVIWRGPMLGGVIRQFLFDVEWGEKDFLIIDLPPGTGDVQLTLSQNVCIDGSIIVTTPHELSTQDSIKGLNMFKKLQIPIIGIVENMSYFICDNCQKEHPVFGEGLSENMIGELQTSLLAKIPLAATGKKNNILSFDENSINSLSNVAYLEIIKSIMVFSGENNL